MRLVGAGTIDTSTGVASGGGAYTHFRKDGTVFTKGIWKVTEFISFESYGGPNAGIQGGLLKIMVYARHTVPPPAELIFMGIICCRVNAPEGAPDEGVTIWNPGPIPPRGTVPVFGIVVSGHVFYLNK